MKRERKTGYFFPNHKLDPSWHGSSSTLASNILNLLGTKKVASQELHNINQLPNLEVKKAGHVASTKNHASRKALKLQRHANVQKRGALTSESLFGRLLGSSAHKQELLEEQRSSQISTLSPSVEIERNKEEVFSLEQQTREEATSRLTKSAEEHKEVEQKYRKAKTSENEQRKEELHLKKEEVSRRKEEEPRIREEAERKKQAQEDARLKREVLEEERLRREEEEKLRRAQEEARIKREAEEKERLAQAQREQEERERKEREVQAQREKEERERKEREAQAQREKEERERKEREAQALKEQQERERKELEAKAQREKEERRLRKEAERKREAEQKAKRELGEELKQLQLTLGTCNTKLGTLTTATGPLPTDLSGIEGEAKGVATEQERLREKLEDLKQRAGRSEHKDVLTEVLRNTAKALEELEQKEIAQKEYARKVEEEKQRREEEERRLRKEAERKREAEQKAKRELGEELKQLQLTLGTCNTKLGTLTTATGPLPTDLSGIEGEAKGVATEQERLREKLEDLKQRAGRSEHKDVLTEVLRNTAKALEELEQKEDDQKRYAQKVEDEKLRREEEAAKKRQEELRREEENKEKAIKKFGEKFTTLEETFTIPYQNLEELVKGVVDENANLVVLGGRIETLKGIFAGLRGKVETFQQEATDSDYKDSLGGVFKNAREALTELGKKEEACKQFAQKLREEKERRAEEARIKREEERLRREEEARKFKEEFAKIESAQKERRKELTALEESQKERKESLETIAEQLEQYRQQEALIKKQLEEFENRAALSIQAEEELKDVRTQATNLLEELNRKEEENKLLAEKLKKEIQEEKEKKRLEEEERLKKEEEERKQRKEEERERKEREAQAQREKEERERKEKERLHREDEEKPVVLKVYISEVNRKIWEGSKEDPSSSSLTLSTETLKPQSLEEKALRLHAELKGTSTHGPVVVDLNSLGQKNATELKEAVEKLGVPKSVTFLEIVEDIESENTFADLAENESSSVESDHNGLDVRDDDLTLPHPDLPRPTFKSQIKPEEIQLVFSISSSDKKSASKPHGLSIQELEEKVLREVETIKTKSDAPKTDQEIHQKALAVVLAKEIEHISDDENEINIDLRMYSPEAAFGFQRLILSLGLPNPLRFQFPEMGVPNISPIPDTTLAKRTDTPSTPFTPSTSFLASDPLVLALQSPPLNPSLVVSDPSSPEDSGEISSGFEELLQEIDEVADHYLVSPSSPQTTCYVVFNLGPVSETFQANTLNRLAKTRETNIEISYVDLTPALKQMNEGQLKGHDFFLLINEILSNSSAPTESEIVCDVRNLHRVIGSPLSKFLEEHFSVKVEGKPEDDTFEGGTIIFESPVKTKENNPHPTTPRTPNRSNGFINPLDLSTPSSSPENYFDPRRLGSPESSPLWNAGALETPPSSGSPCLFTAGQLGTPPSSSEGTPLRAAQELGTPPSSASPKRFTALELGSPPVSPMLLNPLMFSPPSSPNTPLFGVDEIGSAPSTPETTSEKLLSASQLPTPPSNESTPKVRGASPVVSGAPSPLRKVTVNHTQLSPKKKAPQNRKSSSRKQLFERGSDLLNKENIE